MGMHLKETLRTVVEAMLPRWSGKLGLTFGINVKYSYYGDSDDSEETKSTTLIFLILRVMNYTKVFVSEEACTGMPTEMKLVADHDSCWSDGLSHAVLKVHGQFYDYFINKGIEMKQISQHTGFDIFKRPRYIPVEYFDLIEGDRFNGVYKIKTGRMIESWRDIPEGLGQYPNK